MNKSQEEQRASEQICRMASDLLMYWSDVSDGNNLPSFRWLISAAFKGKQENSGLLAPSKVSILSGSKVSAK
jgi:hypothetical protein